MTSPLSVEVYRVMLHTKYQGSRPYGFRQEDFFHVSPHLSLCKACDPRGWAIFGPRGIVWTNLVVVYQMMLHSKYQGSRPCGFRQEEFFMFLPILIYVKHVTPGAGPFWPQGYHLNKLGRGLLGDATYKLSKLYALWFQRRRFLKFSSWKSIVSLCDLDMQWTKTIWTILKEGHIRIISSKFGQNPASSLGIGVIWSNCGRRTTHDGRRTPNDHNSSPWANGSGELK